MRNCNKKRKISPKTEKKLDISVKNRNSGWKTEFLYSEIKTPASKGIIFCMEPYGPEVFPLRNGGRHIQLSCIEKRYTALTTDGRSRNAISKEIQTVNDISLQTKHSTMAGTIQCKMFLSVFQQTMISAAARELEPVSLDYPSSGLQSRTSGTERFF